MSDRTGQEFSSVYRSRLLENSINSYLDGGTRKMTLVDLINAMGNAGTQDLRGVELLPYALKIIGQPSDPALAQAVNELQPGPRVGRTGSTVRTPAPRAATTRAKR